MRKSGFTREFTARSLPQVGGQSHGARLLSNDMLREYNWSLTEADVQYQSLFEAASDAILIVDRGGAIVRCNARAENLFGESSINLQGLHLSLLFPDNPVPRAGVPQTIEDLIQQAQPGRSYSFEWSCLRKSGIRFISETGLAIIRSGNADYAQLILRDSSERTVQLIQLQETVAQRDLLMKEVHHRVKNNLQLIQSMIELQRNASGPGDGKVELKKIQSRVSTLTAAYLALANQPEDLLVKIDDFAHRICEIQRGEARSMGISLEILVACGGVHVSLDQAVPIGLILRELILNAAVHGYRGDKEGRVDVVFEDKGACIGFSVRDYGHGLSGNPDEGLGLSIAAALFRQLGGSLCIKNMEPGTLVVSDFEKSAPCGAGAHSCS